MKPRHPNDVESVRQARRSLSLILRKLLKPTPEALDACVPHLHNAIDSIDWLQSRLAMRESQSPISRRTLQTEMAELRRELLQVTALMRSASGFYGGLARLLSPLEDDISGYAPNGTVSSRAAPTLQLEG
jgi:hypothetical protein